MALYLDHYKGGWSHTAVYLLRDRTDESGDQSFGFYKGDYTPRKSAIYLHNLTTILADTGSFKPGKLQYAIPNQPETVHEMLLQKRNGTFELVVWDEKFASGGTDDVHVNLGVKHRTVKVYDTTVGTTAVQTLNGVNSVPLTLSNHPVVLEIP
jgi:hypothetical protein